VVLGAGGTARAAVFALRDRGARVTVLNRTRDRADALVRELGAERAGPLDELAALDWDLLVNTTSVGLRSDESPVPAEALRAGVVLDAVYDPPETRLLREARARGARTVGGKWMLVEQAVEQIRLWTGKDAPADRMADAFDRAR
jgi:shikimate dehydrogenase